MLDTIYIKNKQEVTIIFLDRTPVRITDSDGQALELALDLLGLRNRRLEAAEEVTQWNIDLKVA